MQIKHLAYIRDNFDPRLYEALASTQNQVTNIEQQVGANANAEPAPPNGPQGIQVAGQNGYFHVAIVDQSPGLRRGVTYTIEHADNPAFTNAQAIQIGSARNHTFSLSNTTRYFRAYSNGPWSGPSNHIVFGGATPVAVNAGGLGGAPILLPSQGTGTSAPGQMGFGQGPVPVRDVANGFDWTKQRAGFGTAAGLVASIGIDGGGTSGGSGGGGGGGGTSNSPPILNLVFDGDSLTKGEYGSVANPYPSKVGERLNMSATYIHNLGENGATTATLLASHVSVADGLYNPALGTNWYILWIGVNDFLLGTPIGTTQTNIQSIIAGRIAAGFNTLVLFNTPQNYATSPAGWEAWRDQMRAWYLAGSSGALAFLNTGDINVLSNPNWTQYYDSDKLHISDLGYIVIASGVASYLLSSLGGFNNLLPQPAYPGATPINTNFTTYDVSIEQYGALAGVNGVSSWNTKAIQFAAAAASAAGVGLYAPGEYYLVDKTNLPYGIKFYSTCTNPAVTGAVSGTRFVGSGSGLSWLKGVMNAAVPNGGNTGPSTTATTYGLQWDGIIADVAAAVTGLVGIWLVRQFQFSTDNCGVSGNISAAWTAGILFDTGVVGQVRRPQLNYATTGIALGGSASNALTADVDIIDPVISHCTTGISTAFSQYCNVYRGSIQTCTTGYLGGGPNNSLYDVLFGTGGATNTADYNETATATAPFGGTFTNDHKIIGNCTFTGSVAIKHATGTTFVGTTWGGSSSLNIDSNCVSTNLLQQNSFPATAFTDNGTQTYLASFVSGTTNPNVATPGVTGQVFWDATHLVLYTCTTSGAGGSAVWTPQANGVTSVNGATGAVTVVPTFNGSASAAVGISSASALKFKYGVSGFSSGQIHLTAAGLGLATIVTASATMIIEAGGNPRWVTTAFSSTDLYIYSYDVAGVDSGDSTNAAAYQVYGT